MEQRWAVLEGENGWQFIVPTPDIEAHAKVILIDKERFLSDEEQTGDLAEFDCPCKPQVDWKDKLIIHNSFKEMKK